MTVDCPMEDCEFTHERVERMKNHLFDVHNLSKEQILHIYNAEKLHFYCEKCKKTLYTRSEHGKKLHMKRKHRSQESATSSKFPISCLVKECDEKFQNYEETCTHIVAAHPEDVVGFQEKVSYKFDSREQLLEHVRQFYSTAFIRSCSGANVEYWRCAQAGAQKYKNHLPTAKMSGPKRKKVVDYCSANMKIQYHADGSCEASGRLFHVGHPLNPLEMTPEETEELLNKQMEFERKKSMKELESDTAPSSTRGPFKHLKFQLRDCAVSGVNPRRYRCPQCSEELDATAWKYHESRGCGEIPSTSRVLCLLCMEGFMGREAMMEHYSARHSLLDIQSLTFANRILFEDFRYELKKAGHNFSNRGQSGKTGMERFRCFIGVSCTAYIDVREQDDGSLNVDFCNHHSHDVDENNPIEEAGPSTTENTVKQEILEDNLESLPQPLEVVLKTEIVEDEVDLKKEIPLIEEPQNPSFSSPLSDLLAKFISGRESLKKLEILAEKHGETDSDVQKAMRILWELEGIVDEMEDEPF